MIPSPALPDLASFWGGLGLHASRGSHQRSDQEPPARDLASGFGSLLGLLSPLPAGGQISPEPAGNAGDPQGSPAQQPTGGMSIPIQVAPQGGADPGGQVEVSAGATSAMLANSAEQLPNQSPQSPADSTGVTPEDHLFSQSQQPIHPTNVVPSDTTLLPGPDSPAGTGWQPFAVGEPGLAESSGTLLRGALRGEAGDGQAVPLANDSLSAPGIPPGSESRTLAEGVAGRMGREQLPFPHPGNPFTIQPFEVSPGLQLGLEMGSSETNGQRYSRPLSSPVASGWQPDFQEAITPSGELLPAMASPQARGVPGEDATPRLGVAEDSPQFAETIIAAQDGAIAVANQAVHPEALASVQAGGAHPVGGDQHLAATTAPSSPGLARWAEWTPTLLHPQAGTTTGTMSSTAALIRDQVASQLLPLMKDHQPPRQVTLQLDPPHLGTLTVKIELQDGQLTITFAAAGPEAEAALREGADKLAESLLTRSHWSDVHIRWEKEPPAGRQEKQFGHTDSERREHPEERESRQRR